MLHVISMSVDIEMSNAIKEFYLSLNIFMCSYTLMWALSWISLDMDQRATPSNRPPPIVKLYISEKSSLEKLPLRTKDGEK